MPEKIRDISQDQQVIKIISEALKEDVGSGDHSSLACIQPGKISSAVLIFKEEGVAAGISIAQQVLKMNDPHCIVEVLMHDGDKVKKGDIGFRAEGNAQALLKSERLLLNILQRLSGIATVTRQAVSLLEGFHTRVLDTRKTTPNLRILEKWAVTVGGGHNHRIGLYDMIMLKDNHVDVAGGVVPAIKMAKGYLQAQRLDLGIEVETRNLEEVAQALTVLPIQRIMLDNFSPGLTRQAVDMIAGRCETEASGGITLDNIRQYAEVGVDFISLGMLTHSVKSLDMSFKIKL